MNMDNIGLGLLIITLAGVGMFALGFLAFYFDAKSRKSDRARLWDNTHRRGPNSFLANPPATPDPNTSIKFGEQPTPKIVWGDPVAPHPPPPIVLRCPVCRRDIVEKQRAHACDFNCGTLYHDQCWKYLMQEGTKECAVCRQHLT